MKYSTETKKKIKKKKPCGCSEKKENFLGTDSTLSSAVLANNQQQNNASDSTKLAMQTNSMIIGATIIIAIALIVNKNNGTNKVFSPLRNYI